MAWSATVAAATVGPLSPSAMRSAGWTCVAKGRHGKIGQRWLHVDGWRLEHCGHPTAHYPWAQFAPAGALVCTGAAGPARNPVFGTAWPNLRKAVEFVSSAFAMLTPEDGR